MFNKKNINITRCQAQKEHPGYFVRTRKFTKSFLINRILKHYCSEMEIDTIFTDTLAEAMRLESCSLVELCKIYKEISEE